MTSVPYGRSVDGVTLLGELSDRQKTPISAMLQLTERCNFRCKHCYQTHRKRRDLTTRQWLTILDNLRDSGVLFVTFSGGEPLVRKDLFEIAAGARERSFALKLKTNGWMLDRKVADRLASLAFLEVHLSLYSSRSSVHDAITGMKGSHRRVKSAGRMLVRRGIGVLMNTPLMNVNADQLDDIIDMCEAEDFGWAMDPHLTLCQDGGCSPRTLRMTPEQMRSVFENPKVLDVEAVARAASLRKASDKVCNAGRVSCVISSNAEVLPCPLLEHPLGNILETSLSKIWKTSPERQRIDDIRWASLETCPDCELLPWCQRCHGVADVEDGDMMGPSKLACDAARIRRDVCLATRSPKP